MKRGRPKGIPMSPEWRAQMSERSRRMWADPAYREARLAELRASQPKATAASPRTKRIKPTDPVKRNLYRKMVDCGVPRGEILRELQILDAHERADG